MCIRVLHPDHLLKHCREQNLKWHPAEPHQDRPPPWPNPIYYNLLSPTCQPVVYPSYYVQRCDMKLHWRLCTHCRLPATHGSSTLPFWIPKQLEEHSHSPWATTAGYFLRTTQITVFPVQIPTARGKKKSLALPGCLHPVVQWYPTVCTTRKDLEFNLGAWAGLIDANFLALYILNKRRQKIKPYRCCIHQCSHS